MLSSNEFACLYALNFTHLLIYTKGVNNVSFHQDW